MKARLLVAATISLALPPALFAQATNAPPATNAVIAPVPPPNPFPNAVPSGEIIEQAQSALAKFPAPPAIPQPDPGEAAVRQKMGEMGDELQLFSDETTRLLLQNPSLDHIRSLERLGQYFAGYPASWTATITDRSDRLNKRLTQVTAATAKWNDTLGALKLTPPVPPEYAQQINAVLARLEAVRRDTVAQEKSLPQLQAQIAGNGSLVSNALNRLDTARDRAISQLFEPNAPPLWSGTPMAPASEANTLSWSKQSESLTNYVRSAPGKFLIHGFLLAVLTGLFYWLRAYARRRTREEPGIAAAAGLFEMPLAIAGLLSLAASPLLYYPIAPRLLSALLGAIALIPSVIVVRRLIDARVFPILYALVAFFFLEEFRSVAALPPAAARAFLLAEILGAVSFLGWLLLRLAHRETLMPVGRAVRLGARAACVLLAAGWLAEVLGFTLMANLLCVAVQRSATLALALYAGIRIMEALLFILTRLRPFADLGMVRDHSSLLLHHASRILTGGAILIWVLVLLSQIPVQSSVIGDIGSFFGSYDDHHNLVLTLPGKILTAVIVAWGLYQLSRFVRFILETDFYPRLHLAAGIPYAISTSLHYAMLVVAFVAVSYVLGIDMTKFTILVSALGVGVGFGLQNIINNFVSGLILLFERPVKIGDSVQVGADSGTVERIGIRASVLRTASGSELIVPNGSLISNNVTNWTLTSRERILIVPLNVVRGPDLTHLIELLTTTAAADPRVLKDPPPRVLAQALGANLSLELRAWTRASDDWGLVRSELVLAVNAALAKENVALA